MHKFIHTFIYTYLHWRAKLLSFTLGLLILTGSYYRLGLVDRLQKGTIKPSMLALKEFLHSHTSK